MEKQTEVKALITYLQESYALETTLALLQWDQETYLPKHADDHRSLQIETLSKLLHQRNTATELEDLVHSNAVVAQNSGDARLAKNVEMLQKTLDKQKKLSEDLVGRIAKTASQALSIWVKARTEGRFEDFAPILEQTIALQREKAESLGYKTTPYDALMAEYDEGLTTADVNEILGAAREPIVNLVQAIQAKQAPDGKFFEQQFDPHKQMELCKWVAQKMGYSMETGRLDLSAHPFSITLGPKDSRITTHLDGDMRNGMWSTMHEVGHALYELGLAQQEMGMPESMATSLSIHESQSRLWENHVGKSMPFIGAMMPVLDEHFPGQIGNTSSIGIYNALNAVHPNLIRIHSDELTYHLHIILRFEIESALIEGRLEVKDVEAAWNEKVKNYLGLDVPTPTLGVLQDIHWSHGSFGYFPTYSVGSFCSAQLWSSLSAAVPKVEEQIASLQFEEILQWLRTHVHGYGKLKDTQETMIAATGEKLDTKHFVRYAEAKFGAIYGL